MQIGLFTQPISFLHVQILMLAYTSNASSQHPMTSSAFTLTVCYYSCKRQTTKEQRLERLHRRKLGKNSLDFMAEV